MGLKQQVKSFIVKNDLTKGLYDIYHDHAKYIYQIGKPRFDVHDHVNMTVFDQHQQTFFGYYDKSPECKGHYLYHALDNSSLKLDQEIDIYIDDHKVGTSHSWNWQQGAMASWLGDDEIIYNDFIDGHYQSVIRDITGNLVKIIDHPIYQISKGGSFALSVNFSRLAKLRSDYGYFNMPYDDIKKLDDRDGIFYIDIINNKQTLLADLVTIANTEPHSSMDDAYHEVNHVDISEDQTKAIFLHRWYKDKKHYSRLMLIDITTAQVKVLVDEGMVSHCTWKNDHQIVGYLRYEKKDGYFLIDIYDNKVSRLDSVTDLVDDGHPSFTKDERFMITDTYPDHTCRSKLFLCDMISKEITLIGSFYAPRKYQGTKRCDLHPRWSLSKHEITFDSVYGGRRQLCKVDLEKLIRSNDNGEN